MAKKEKKQPNNNRFTTKLLLGKSKFNTATSALNAGNNSIQSGRLTSTSSLIGSNEQTASTKTSSRASLITLNDVLTPEEFLAKRGFNVQKAIGEGAFAKVYVVLDKDQRKFAFKVFDLTSNENKGWVTKCLKKEMIISKKLKHPNIIMTYDVLKTRRFGYIQMKFAPNGNIKEDLFQKKVRPYNEDEARNYFKGLMEGLNHMHGQNICHRDLKLENFLLSETNCPLISDFGFASIGMKLKTINTMSNTVLTSLMQYTRCGTKDYMAPELKSVLFKPPYDAKAVDIYAMGVCLFEMVNFCYPHQLPGNQLTINGKLSDSLNELIGLMLKMEPQERIHTETILNHRWVVNSLINSLFNSTTTFGTLF